jgi:hypothetical protein
MYGMIANLVKPYAATPRNMEKGRAGSALRKMARQKSVRMRPCDMTNQQMEHVSTAE